MRYLIPMLTLVLAACQGDETVSRYADQGVPYTLGQMNGAQVTVHVTLTLSPDGQINGQAPCNRYSTATTVPYPWFEISGIAATRRTCPQQDTENEYFATLQAMTLAEVSGKMLLLTNDGTDSLVFMRP